MQKILLMFALSVSVAALPITAGAHGCIKGAAIGGLAGHLAGHHAVAGAVLGCAVGHHRAKVKEKEATRAQGPAQSSTAEGATPH